MLTIIEHLDEAECFQLLGQEETDAFSKKKHTIAAPVDDLNCPDGLCTQRGGNNLRGGGPLDKILETENSSSVISNSGVPAGQESAGSHGAAITPS